MVEPVDPFEGCIFDGFKIAPRTTPVDDFCFEKAVDCFGESVVIRIPDTADRWRDLRLCQPLCVLNRQILRSAIRMMHQLILGRPALMNGLIQCFYYPAGDCGAICREGRTNPALAVRLARQPTIRLAKTSMTKAT